MSADNWGICPQCHKAYRDPPSGYGVLSEEEYVASLAKEPKTEEATLREGYYVGTVDDGEFEIAYTCSCEVCGLSFRYEHKEQVPLNGNKTRPARKKGRK